MAIIAGGCTPEVHQYKRFPQLFSPGPAALQRDEAIVHDPYPLDDVGPEIEGGRPREYQQPVNEVERAKMYSNGIRAAAWQPVPPGPWQTGAPIVTGPPVVTGPPIVTGPPVVTGAPVVTGPPVVTAPYAPPAANPYQVQPRSPY